MVKPLVLVDSNICIYLIEGLSDAARRHVESFAPGEVVTSAVAYAEVMRGVDSTNRPAVAHAEALFDAIAVMDFGRDAALAYGDLPFRRHRFDRLIAAHAVSLGLRLATNDERDFEDVPGLKVENWTKP